MPLEQYKNNLRIIVTNAALGKHNPTILLVTPPPIHEEHLEAEDLKKGCTGLTRRQSVTAQYAQAVRDLAAELEDRVVLVDLHKAMMDEAARLTSGHSVNDALLGTKEAGDSKGFRELLVDGLHFTGAGYKVFLDAVIPHVGQQWAREPANEPSWIFP